MYRDGSLTERKTLYIQQERKLKVANSQFNTKSASMKKRC